MSALGRKRTFSNPSLLTVPTRPALLGLHQPFGLPPTLPKCTRETGRQPFPRRSPVAKARGNRWAAPRPVQNDGGPLPPEGGLIRRHHFETRTL